jgi:hypothetical protein
MIPIAFRIGHQGPQFLLPSSRSSMATLIAFFDERPSGPILDLMIFMRYLEIRLSAHAKARRREAMLEPVPLAIPA